MHEILKAASLEKAAALEPDELALINRQTLRELGADEVFVFRLAACGDKVDRDHERFTLDALETMARLYPGKPVLMGHGGPQTARVYAAAVEPDGNDHRLVLRCYMPRTEKSAETIAAIEGGVLRECSVSVGVGKVLCSICGADQRETICLHYAGRSYDGQVCHFDLDAVKDVYEVSLVPIPAQPEAGVIKSKRYGGAEAPGDGGVQLARARLELEKIRFGGI